MRQHAWTTRALKNGRQLDGREEDAMMQEQYIYVAHRAPTDTDYGCRQLVRHRRCNEAVRRSLPPGRLNPAHESVR